MSFAEKSLVATVTEWREPALADFETFCDVIGGCYPYRCHRKWIEGLSRHRRLLITAPPEHAKTTYIAVLYPAWRIARRPSIRTIIVCSTDAGAQERARAVQSVITTDVYREAFPWVVPAEPWTAGNFTVRRDRVEDPFPTVWACGVGSSSLIGRRADLIILDDPMTEETARSELQRRLLDIWLRRTLLTRLTDAKDAQMVCIMTRWHEADAAATLLDMGFHHLAQPASPESPVWPERFGREYLEQRRREMGSALYNCMYLGDPSGLEGRLIKREWFEAVSIPPELRQVVIGWDLATSERQSADRSVGTVLGEGEDGRLYVLNVCAGRWEWPETRRQIIALAERFPEANQVGIETGGFQLAAVQEVRAALGAIVPVRAVRADRDKVSRSLPWIALAENWQVRLVKADWNREWLDELAMFPSGSHDDQVDSMSIAYAALKAGRRIQFV